MHSHLHLNKLDGKHWYFDGSDRTIQAFNLDLDSSKVSRHMILVHCKIRILPQMYEGTLGSFLHVLCGFK